MVLRKKDVYKGHYFYLRSFLNQVQLSVYLKL